MARTYSDTLPVYGMLRVPVVKRLLALSDGCSKREVCVHDPFLVPVDDGFTWHGKGMSLGDIFR